MPPETSSIRRRRYLQAKEAASWCLRTDRRSPPTGTYRRANTTCPYEVGRGSTFLPVASFRKAHVVGPACIRKCPRFFTSVREKPRTVKGSVRIQKPVRSPRFANLCTNRRSGVQRVCQFRHRRGLESEQKDTG